MKTVLLAFVGIIATMPAAAQVSTSILSSPVSAGSAGLEANGAASLRAGGDQLSGSLETPTMRRQKLAQAVALRDEALALQAEDGGVLTDGHVRRIQRKSRAILNYSSQRAGSLLPIRE